MSNLDTVIANIMRFMSDYKEATGIELFMYETITESPYTIHITPSIMFDLCTYDETRKAYVINNSQ